MANDAAENSDFGPGEGTYIYEFPGFRLDERERILFAVPAGERVALPDKAFDTLVYLLRNRGRLVAKKELLDHVWAEAFVEENNLNKSIYAIRRALAPHSDVEYIETVKRHGFRFTAEVAHVAAVADPERGDESAVSKVSEQGPPPAASSVSAEPVRKIGPSRRWLVPAVALVLLLSVFAGLYIYRSAEVKAAKSRVLGVHQLTSFDGLDLFPTFSRHGNMLAYSSNKSGGFEIYVRQMAPGAADLQLTSDGGNNLQPSFSPDGTQIAYSSLGRRGIWIVPASGGTARRLTAWGSNPAWSPDGASIAYQSDPVNDLGSNARNAMPPSTLWVVTADGSSDPRQLTTAGSPPGGHGAPEWSPDGKRIVFDSGDWASSRVWSINSDGSDLTPLLLPDPSAPPERRFVVQSDPIYSPDGRSITFVANVGLSVESVPVDEHGAATAVPTKILDASSARVRHPAHSPDGKLIVYSSISTNSNLFTSKIGEDVAAPEPLTHAAAARSLTPSFAPDGKEVVYQQFATGTSSVIKAIGVDGSRDRALTTKSGVVPTWFPKGDKVGFTVMAEHGSEFWMTYADGSGEQKVFDYGHPDVTTGKLTPDGKNVIFNSKGSGTVNLWTIPIQGGESRQLTFDPEMAAFPAISPDGKWIAFQLKRGDDTHVAFIPVNGGDIVQVTKEPGQSWVSDWLPDSDGIVFAGYRDSRWNIYAVSRSTGKVRRLTQFNKLNSYVRYPAASPTGDRIAYEYAESTGNLWTIELDSK